MDRHRFDANPDLDPNFHGDADPDPTRMRVGIRRMPIPMRILPQVLHLLENQNCQSEHCQFTMFYLSHQCQMCHN